MASWACQSTLERREHEAAGGVCAGNRRTNAVCADHDGRRSELEGSTRRSQSNQAEAGGALPTHQRRRPERSVGLARQSQSVAEDGTTQATPGATGSPGGSAWRVRMRRAVSYVLSAGSAITRPDPAPGSK